MVPPSPVALCEYRLDKAENWNSFAVEGIVVGQKRPVRRKLVA
jgi:hypothetical protein